jgi:REP element-mobilizing transposase RayT
MDDKIERYMFPVRKNLRLQRFDYSSQNAYFITVCSFQKQYLFGAVENDRVKLNVNGKIVQSCWNNLALHYPGICNELFKVMPNHVHGIIIISDENGRDGSKPSPTKRHHLSEIVRAFKTYSSKRINELRLTVGTTVWQRSYFEHVIRNEKIIVKLANIY